MERCFDFLAALTGLIDGLFLVVLVVVLGGVDFGLIFFLSTIPLCEGIVLIP